MAIRKDLLLSILSLDAYNRGYGAGISDGGEGDVDGLGETGQVGTATISFKLSDVSEGFANEAESAGFYAIAYDTPGYGTVISYRETDDPRPYVSGSDFWNGWTIGAGFSGASQAGLTQQFYDAVAGHSLGGGLQGSGQYASPHSHAPTFKYSISFNTPFIE